MWEVVQGKSKILGLSAVICREHIIQDLSVQIQRQSHSLAFGPPPFVSRLKKTAFCVLWHEGHTHTHTHRYRRRHVKHIEHFHFGWCWTAADRHPAHVPIPGAVEGSMIQGNQGKVGRSETAVFPVFTEAMALCQRLSSRWSSSGLSLA